MRVPVYTKFPKVWFVGGRVVGGEISIIVRRSS